MSNKGKTNQKTRTLFYRTMESIMLYGAPIWEKEMHLEANKQVVRNTQRAGLQRIASAYRTVPLESLAAITGVVPWSIKVKERRVLLEWEKELEKGKQPERRNLRSRTRGQPPRNFYNEDF